MTDIRKDAEPVWYGWGAAERHHPLPDAVRALLSAGLGEVEGRETPPVDLAAVRLQAPALPHGSRDALVAAVGAGNLHDDHDSRVRHCRGRSSPDLLRIRAGDGSDAPDAVVLPGDAAEVAAVLAVAVDHHIAVVPYGGGTSVVGGLAPARDGYAGVIALDLRRLDRLLSIDAVSSTATLEAGMRTPDAEAALAAYGLTLGHFPQSFEYATIGGYAATRSVGQASAGYGRFDDLVVALSVATPIGPWEVGRSPASAAGPDLRHVVLGSEGAFGVITAVTVRVRPAPEQSVYEAWRLPDFASATGVVRAMTQQGVCPTVVRVSDEAETAVGLADPRTIGEAGETGGCHVIVGYDGTGDVIAVHRAAVTAMLTAAGATALGAAEGQRWAKGRFDGPYLRDSLLDIGMFVETLETAGFWSVLPALYSAVRGALAGSLTAAGSPPIVLCHVSHPYPTGASLYFTVVCAGSDDMIAVWDEAKAAASASIAAHGGTITHHHAVGTDHREAAAVEIGPVGVRVLRAVKDALDPSGVLNPGILIPPRPIPPTQ